MADDDAIAKPSSAPGTHLGPARTSPYPMSRLAPAYDLVHVAQQIQDADRMVGAVVGGKLDVIARQIRALQEEAKELLVRAQRDAELHHAKCNFVRRPGHLYHAYRRGNGELYLSMLSPADWGGKPPHAHEGSYRLEPDQSWTPEEEIQGAVEPPEMLVRKLLAAELPDSFR